MDNQEVKPSGEQLPSEDQFAAGKGVYVEFFILFLALASVLLLALEVAGDISSEQQRMIELIDVGIACIFLTEFIYRFVKAERKGVFFKRHWWELLASIPITNEVAQSLRGLRLLRLVRLLRLLRLIRFMVRVRILLNRSRAFSKDTSLIYLATVVSVIVFASALAFHYFEVNENKSVTSFWDSFWWAMVTVTTVGYGDIFPITVGGRLVGIFLMLTGIGTLGAFTASIASYAVRQKRAEDEEAKE